LPMLNADFIQQFQNALHSITGMLFDSWLTLHIGPSGSIVSGILLLADVVIVLGFFCFV
jgi:hypothetical protein